MDNEELVTAIRSGVDRQNNMERLTKYKRNAARGLSAAMNINQQQLHTLKRMHSEISCLSLNEVLW